MDVISEGFKLSSGEAMEAPHNVGSIDTRAMVMGM